MKAILLMADWRERNEVVNEHIEARQDIEADRSLFETDLDSGVVSCKSPLTDSKLSVLDTTIGGCLVHIAVIEDQITDYYNEATAMIDKLKGGSPEQGEMEDLARRLEAYVIEIDG